MAAPTLSPEAALGSSTSQLVFQTNSQCVSVCGQRLKFASCHALTEPDETRWHMGSSPHGIALVAACPKARLFAFTERVLEPTISVCSFPDMLQQMTLEWSTPLEFTALAFSRSGEQLAALSGLPEPTLVVWNLATQTILASGPLLVPGDAVSFNPLGDGAIATLAAKRLLLWDLKLVYKTYMLESAEVALEDGEASTDSWTDASWASGGVLYATTESGSVVEASPGKEPLTILRCSTPVRTVAADATHFVIGCADGTLRWYARAGDDELFEGDSCLWSLQFDSSLQSLTLSPDYRSLLSVSELGETTMVQFKADVLPEEQAAIVTDVVSHERVASFHQGAVVAAAALPVFSGDGGVGSLDIVTCSTDGTIRCHDTLTRLEVARILTASDEPPTALATSPASMLVAVGTADGVLRLFQRRAEQGESAAHLHL
jgi:WD40 repeat protein